MELAKDGDMNSGLGNELSLDTTIREENDATIGANGTLAGKPPANDDAANSEARGQKRSMTNTPTKTPTDKDAELLDHVASEEEIDPKRQKVSESDSASALRKSLQPHSDQYRSSDTQKEDENVGTNSNKDQPPSCTKSAQNGGHSPVDGSDSGKTRLDDELPDDRIRDQTKDQQLNAITEALKKVPKLAPKEDRTMPVWLSCPGQRDEVIKCLHKEENVTKNIFKKIITVKNPNALLVILNRPEHSETLAEMLKGTDATMHKKNPTNRSEGTSLLLVDFVLDPMTPAAIRNAIIKQNGSIGSDFIVQKVYSNSSPACAIVRCLTAECFQAFSRLEQIHVGTSTGDLHRFHPLNFCDSCCQLGHDSKKCVYPNVSICMWCASVEHSAAGCPLKRAGGKFTKKCFNCAMSGYEDRHAAASISCSHRIAKMRAICEEKEKEVSLL